MKKTLFLLSLLCVTACTTSCWAMEKGKKSLKDTQWYKHRRESTYTMTGHLYNLIGHYEYSPRPKDQDRLKKLQAFSKELGESIRLEEYNYNLKREPYDPELIESNVYHEIEQRCILNPEGKSCAGMYVLYKACTGDL